MLRDMRTHRTEQEALDLNRGEGWEVRRGERKFAEGFIVLISKLVKQWLDYIWFQNDFKLFFCYKS